MKKSSGKDGTFGAPKPLPGQPGYKMAESDVLQNEAKEMEARLQILQDKLKASQIETEKPLATSSSSSSNKWKSANTEKGSIRAYGKDVTEKFKKRIVNEGGVFPTIKPSNSSRDLRESSPSTVTPTEQSTVSPPTILPSTTPNLKFAPEEIINTSSLGNFSTKLPEEWTIEDVTDWLRHIKLDQYTEIFIANEINGSVLLEFTLEDLDYLQITILAHRKTLLRGINDLKQSTGNPASSSNPLNNKKAAANDRIVASGLQRSLSANRMVDGDKVILSKSAEVKKPVHWSQLEPLSASQVKGDGTLLVNAADKAGTDIFDEEAERQAFMEAVAEWRKSDTTGTNRVTIVREFEMGKGRSSSTSTATATATTKLANDSLWKNPFAAEEPSKSTKSSLLSGQLDEQQEHAEFVKAVEAWRGSKPSAATSKNDPVSSNTPRATESISVGDSTTGMKSPNDKTKRLAENIAKQLEANLELEKIRRNKLIHATSIPSPREEEENKKSRKIPNDFEVIRVASSAAKDDNNNNNNDKPRPTSVPTAEAIKPASRKNSSNKMNINYDDSDDEGKGVRIHTTSNIDYPSTVKIALVESIITSPLEREAERKFSPQKEEEEGFCVVEYESDE